MSGQFWLLVHQMTKYQELLEMFGVVTEGMLRTTSYVSMDNIHDAIIDTGVQMDMPIEWYSVAAKQAAIDEYRAICNQRRLRDIKGHLTATISEEWEWEEYGFTPLEIEAVKEWIGNVPAKRSLHTEWKRRALRKTIKKKTIAYLRQENGGLAQI